MANLPFELRPEAAAHWLAQMDSAPPKTRGRHLYTVLQAMTGITPAEVRLPLLEILRPSVYTASEILARDFTRLAAPLSETARNTAKLSVFLHHQLAAGYESLTEESAPLAGHRALVSLGWMLVRILQLGEPIGSGVWQRLYRLYRQGQTQGWLTRPVADPTRKNTEETPLEAFKHAVMFVALAPMRFDPERLGELYLLLSRYRHAIELNHTPSTDGWYLDLSQPHGPRRAAPEFKQAMDLCLYLNMAPPPAEEGTTPLLRRLRHHLGQPQGGEAYTSDRRVDELWCRRESAMAELKRRQSRSPASGEWLTVPEFELAPMDHAPFATTEPAAPTERVSRVHRRLDGRLRQRRDDPVAVLEIEHIEVRPGDLVILKLLDETRIAAVVRWFQTSFQDSKVRFGLDLFTGKVEHVQAIIPGQGPTPAIGIIQARQRDAALILPPTRIKPGVQIWIGDREAQIIRLLEWTDDFCAYRLFYG
ncbi:MAG: hypothetical protein Kow0060_06730 [Methylohalobius crimeensis]